MFESVGICLLVGIFGILVVVVIVIGGVLEFEVEEEICFLLFGLLVVIVIVG